MVFITHKKTGRVVRHRTLASAKKAAIKQAKMGRDSFVDKEFIDKKKRKASKALFFFPGTKRKLFPRRNKVIEIDLRRRRSKK